MNNKILEQIVREIPPLKRYAIYLTRDADQSEDLVQDTLVRAISNIDKWREGTNLRSWLATILRHLFINNMKKRRPVVTKDGNVDFQAQCQPGSQEARHRLRDIQRAFSHLNKPHRQIVWLICIEQRDYTEVADLLSVPVGTVRSRLCRARSHLRQRVEKNDKEKRSRCWCFHNPNTR